MKNQEKVANVIIDDMSKVDKEKKISQLLILDLDLAFSKYLVPHVGRYYTDLTKY